MGTAGCGDEGSLGASKPGFLTAEVGPSKQPVIGAGVERLAKVSDFHSPASLEEALGPGAHGFALYPTSAPCLTRFTLQAQRQISSIDQSGPQVVKTVAEVPVQSCCDWSLTQRPVRWAVEVTTMPISRLKLAQTRLTRFQSTSSSSVCTLVGASQGLSCIHDTASQQKCRPAGDVPGRRNFAANLPQLGQHLSV